MDSEYALITLRNEKESLLNLIEHGHCLPKQVSRYKHQILSLDFTIKILETHEVQYGRYKKALEEIYNDKCCGFHWQHREKIQKALET